MMKTRIILTALILLLLIPFTKGALMNGLVSYWSCDSTIQDISNSHSVSSIYGTGTVRVNSSVSKLGGASCQFDAANLDINNQSAYNTSSLSMNVWVYTTSVGAGPMAVMGKFNPCDNYALRGYSLMINPTGYYKWSAEYGSVLVTNDNIYISTPGVWEMVTITTNITTAAFYRNGVFISSSTGGAISHTQSILGLQLGNKWCDYPTPVPTHQSEFLKGNLDEAAIWNRDLSPAEVSTLYNSGIGFNPFGTTCVRPYSSFSVTQTNYTYTPSEWQGGSGPNFIDGNYATFALSPQQLFFSYFYLEYEKPINAVNASWYFKDGCVGGSSGYLNVPTPCYSAYTDKIRLRAGSEQITAGNGYGNWECWNGAGWTAIRTNVAGNCYELYGQELQWTVQAMPNATTSLPATLTLIGSPIPHYNMTVDGIYLNTTEQGGTECQANFNTSNFRCANFTLSDCNSATETECNATGLQEQWIMGNISCGNGVNSHDYLFFLDTDNNANVTLNSLSVYNTTPNIPFVFQIFADAWIETPTCNVFNYSSVMVCNTSTMIQIGAQSYVGNVSCYGDNFSQIQNFFIGQCNGTSLYKNVNSTTYSVVYDPVGPSFTFSNFNDEYGWFAKNISGTWSFYDLNLYRINVTIDEGYSIFSQVGINATTYTYNLNYFVGNLTPGRHNVTIYMADSHTKKTLEKEWETSKSLLGNEMEFGVGKGKEKNTISIVALDKDTLLNPWTITKKDDRITFKYSPKKIREIYHFDVTSAKPISIIDNPNSKWKKWIVTGDEWVDFYMGDDSKVEVNIVRNSENSVTFEVGGIKDIKNIEFQSIGEINSIHAHYQFNVYNTTLTYQQSITEGQLENSTLTINHGNQPMNYTATFNYNNAMHSISTFTYPTYDVLLSQFYSSSVPITSVINGTWIIKTLGENNNITFNQTVIKIAMTLNCSNSSYVNALTLYGKDEQTNNPTVFDVNVHFTLWTDNELIVSDMPMELRNQSQYDICLFPNSTVYHMTAIMEYYAPGYSQRQYYLYNMTLSAQHQDVNLYLLALTDTTQVVAYVLDAATLEPVEGAYIRVLRYFPGRNDSYSQVQVAATDNEGKTILMLTTITVFYKFIIEYPAGTIRFETEVQTILSDTKTFLINLAQSSNFGVWNDVQRMLTSVTCTESTKTCRMTYSSKDLTTRTATLKVYEEKGYTRLLLSEQTVSGSSGSIVYLIPTYENNTVYTAEGSVIGYDNHEYPSGIASMITEDNPITGANFRMAMFFPYLLLVIVLGAAFLDIGTIGVVIGSLIALIGGWMLGILPFDFGMGISIVIMFVVIMFKLSRE